MAGATSSASATYVTVKITQPYGRLDRRVGSYAKDFIAREKQLRVRAAHVAQQTASKEFKYVRPPNARPRPGRSSTGGRLRAKINYRTDLQQGMVTLDVKKLDREAPQWIINEIGTGQRARMRYGGVKAPRGRTRKDASYLRTVKSQRGRRISSGLAFGTAPGGRFVPPGGGTRQQLYPIRDLSGFASRRGTRGVPFRSQMRRRPLVIRNEVKPKHFVRTASSTAFREYERSLLAAARSTFAGSKRRP